MLYKVLKVKEQISKQLEKNNHYNYPLPGAAVVFLHLPQPLPTLYDEIPSLLIVFGSTYRIGGFKRQYSVQTTVRIARQTESSPPCLGSLFLTIHPIMPLLFIAGQWFRKFLSACYCWMKGSFVHSPWGYSARCFSTSCTGGPPHIKHQRLYFGEMLNVIEGRLLPY